MEKEYVDFFDFAESAYRVFTLSAAAGLKEPAMLGLAQEACEKYLKWLIAEYYDPEPGKDAERIDRMITKQHGLRYPLKVINRDLIGMQYLPPYKVQDILAKEASIMGADGYYFIARYPDANRYPNDNEDGSFLFEDSMVDECREAVETCRSFVVELSRQFDREAANMEL